jgi:hypothetical protein
LIDGGAGAAEIRDFIRISHCDPSSAPQPSRGCYRGRNRELEESDRGEDGVCGGFVCLSVRISPNGDRILETVARVTVPRPIPQWCLHHLRKSWTQQRSVFHGTPSRKQLRRHGVVPGKVGRCLRLDIQIPICRENGEKPGRKNLPAEINSVLTYFWRMEDPVRPANRTGSIGRNLAWHSNSAE